MIKPSAAAAAYALIAADDREGGEVALRAMPPAGMMSCATESALAGAGWLRIGQQAQGLPYLDRDWAAAPHDSAGLAGAALLQLGLVEPALPALLRAVGGATHDPGAHRLNLGRALTLLNRAEEALGHLREALPTVTHDQSLARRSLAEALMQLGRIEEALELLPAGSDDETLIAARAIALATVRRHDEAAMLLRDTIARMPAATSILLLATELARVRGRYGEAAAMLRLAIDKDPENIAFWVMLAKLGPRGMGVTGTTGRQAADKAIQLAAGKDASTRALALSADAHVLGEAGATAEAEAAWRECLRLTPGMLPALSGLGHLLMQLGRVDEAMDCFRQVRAAAPLQGWSQMIHAREVPEDPAILEQMERTARQASLEGPVRSGLLFTLAAAWDRKKDHGRAFALAREANEASKLLLPYDPAEHRNGVDQEMAFLSAAFMASRTGWGHPSRRPVFVLGMPRSGTTLVEQILGSHSQVHGAGELGQVGELIQRLLAWQIHLGSGVGYPHCVAELTAKDLQRHGAHMLDGLATLAPATAAHVIDKLPHNFERIGLIKLVFPNATIFHVRRDPRDIAVSNYITDYAAKFGGMGFAYDLGWIGEQLVDQDRLMAHWHRVFPGQILEVPYEDLVEDTEGWARRMLNHLGVAWEPQVLEFQDLDRPVKTASVWQVRQPVYKTSKERWRRYAGHLALLDATLSQTPPDPAPLPLPQHEPGMFDAGMAALKGRRPAEAAAAFARLVARNPRHASAHHFLGAALAQQGRLEDARAAMRRSIELHPRHASWYDNLAAIEEAAGGAAAARILRAQAATLRGRTAGVPTKPVAAT